MDIQNKLITVVGLAKSGQAAADLALSKGARVRVSDKRTKDQLSPEVRAWIEKRNLEAEYGGHSSEFAKGSDLLVISPGVPVNAPLLNWARQEKIPVLGEMEFAYRFCPTPIVAITGSNGKSTVSTLIARVLKAAGRDAYLCGNIGTPLSEYIPSLNPQSWVVLEVSSFQLETIEFFRPRVAVFLNISQNHLDRHKDFEEYLTMKKRIFENQTPDDHAVLNRHCEYSRGFAAQLKSKVVWFPRQDEASDRNPNFSAVCAVAGALGIDQSVCEGVFKDFRGLEHRLEYVRSIDGVDFINDSKSTTAEASRWALNRMDRPIIWICGGRDKGIDFSVLNDLAREKVKHIIAIGEAGLKVQNTFQKIVGVSLSNDFEEAIREAKSKAKSGDCVLLSPMCASFDMFDNFEHRGREFKRIVGGL